jgi:hypothetical protein
MFSAQNLACHDHFQLVRNYMDVNEHKRLSLFTDALFWSIWKPTTRRFYENGLLYDSILHLDTNKYKVKERRFYCCYSFHSQNYRVFNNKL